MRVELRTLAAMIVFLLASAWAAAAQTTFATITGAVTDSSGGVIAGAEVAATNVETSITTKTTTNSEGVYTVAQLREGPYMLSITAPGLREFIVTNILLVTRDVRRIDDLVLVRDISGIPVSSTSTVSQEGPQNRARHGAPGKRCCGRNSRRFPGCRCFFRRCRMCEWAEG